MGKLIHLENVRRSKEEAKPGSLLRRIMELYGDGWNEYKKPKSPSKPHPDTINAEGQFDLGLIKKI